MRRAASLERFRCGGKDYGRHDVRRADVEERTVGAATRGELGRVRCRDLNEGQFSHVFVTLIFANL